jgi:molybdopterin-guanine dinucleotide biosynthesis protein A
LRLGRIKALEIINRQSLIERTVDCLSSLGHSVLVVTSQEQFDVIAASRLKGKVMVDLYPGKGALGGIYTGLASADSCYSLVVGCDMPFLNRNLLRYLIDLAPGFDAVIPRIDGMYEPLHAVYSRSCLASISELMEQDSLGISQLFGLVNTRYVDKDEIARFDPQFLSFFNINTLNDLRKAKEIIKQGEHRLMAGKEYSSCD